MTMTFEHEAFLVQGAPVEMVQQLAAIEDLGWEVRLVLERPLFGSRLTVWAQRLKPPPPPDPSPPTPPPSPVSF